MQSETLSEYFAKIGAEGGKVKSARKKAAVKNNLKKAWKARRKQFSKAA